MKISCNFQKFLVLYILSFSKIKYKHLFYKLESIFMNFYRFFKTIFKKTVIGLEILVCIKCYFSHYIVKVNCNEFEKVC